MDQKKKHRFEYAVAAVLIVWLAFYFNLVGLQDFYYGSKYFRPYANLERSPIRDNSILLKNRKILFLEWLDIDSQLFDAQSKKISPAPGLKSVDAFGGNLNMLSLQNGNVLITSGPIWDGEENISCEQPDGYGRSFRNCPLGKTLLYDMKLNRLRWVPFPFVGLAGHTTTLLPDGKVLIVGGEEYALDKEAGYGAKKRLKDNIAIYDPNTFRTQIIGSLQIPRYDHKAILLNDHQVLIFGGSVNTQSSPDALRNRDNYIKNVELIDTKTGKSKILATLPFGIHAYETILPLRNQRFFLPQAKWEHGKFYSEIFDFNHPDHTIIIEGPISKGRYEESGNCSLVNQQKAICVGRKEVREYDLLSLKGKIIDQIAIRSIFHPKLFDVPHVGLLLYGQSRMMPLPIKTIEVFNKERYLKDTQVSTR